MERTVPQIVKNEKEFIDKIQGSSPSSFQKRLLIQTTSGSSVLDRDKELQPPEVAACLS